MKTGYVTIGAYILITINKFTGAIRAYIWLYILGENTEYGYTNYVQVTAFEPVDMYSSTSIDSAHPYSRLPHSRRSVDKVKQILAGWGSVYHCRSFRPWTDGCACIDSAVLDIIEPRAYIICEIIRNWNTSQNMININIYKSLVNRAQEKYGYDSNPLILPLL